ncbi:hypothetical protein [Apilactobacillus xinyiensis]|uniref:hypothetical protein n=1 Tax=Apilactobacillus xinyiensis TaxID=2841032 RepID=UPI00200DADB3|nr:hypothetical protein [Apilactobacillus xinyiensis]MCL0330625.1 hypothetical protein [Apilactobacillus xinyiensis]
MIRYVTLNENKTIDKISNNQFDGSARIFVDSDKEATLIYSPYLCWVDDGGAVHIPSDSPMPAFQKQITDLQNRLIENQKNNVELTQQLTQSSSDNEDLKKKIQDLQMANVELTQQITALQNSQNKGVDNHE